jgi:hypothetical protein
MNLILLDCLHRGNQKVYEILDPIETLGETRDMIL